ncbi:hypothetical protein BO99DRAFT_156785 [Aspergillus violaceofuscus CBS 115571]|uniref:Uncharacterized protein n=1 Tax=Aspergillus violaceofuscus (strain CBS 115571) TaxID=1450538 RepID=A0A2V5HC82_ASPV1|nr:hypothetical protein BO99DRAFT_156785 [Aspergillus violaceofuscus CBS 115571]
MLLICYLSIATVCIPFAFWSWLPKKNRKKEKQTEQHPKSQSEEPKTPVAFSLILWLMMSVLLHLSSPDPGKYSILSGPPG